MQRQTIAFVSLALGLLLPFSVHAADFKLKGLGSSTTGDQTVSIDDLGSETLFFGVGITFNTDGPRTFTSFTNLGAKVSGKYKQKGTGDRKIVFKPNSASIKRIRKALEELAESFGFDDVDIDELKIRKLIGKVNSAGDTLKLKGSVDFAGKADGEKGEGNWKFTTSGALVSVVE